MDGTRGKSSWDRMHVPGRLRGILASLLSLTVLLVGTVDSRAYAAANSKGGAVVVKPGSGPEGTQVTITYPKALSFFPHGITASFYDPGTHGFYIVYERGVGYNVAYDGRSRLTYKAPAAAVSHDRHKSSYTAVVPQGICGIIIQSAQAKSPPPKVLYVSLIGPDGTPVPGVQPGKFKLQCNKYKLGVKVKASPKKVPADGSSVSTVTATFTVKGPVLAVIGAKITKPKKPLIVKAPLAFVSVYFTTNLGTLLPNPPNLKTGRSGQATVTVSSADAGIATVRAIALGIGDGRAQIHFVPEITGVQEDFIPPVSPTNYQIATVPKDQTGLTFDWKIIYPPGPVCGHLTGAASGLGESKNGYYHGPAAGYPDGCDPAKYEAFVKIEVTVTDKAGDSDTKTFLARAYEGMGMVKLP